MSTVPKPLTLHFRDNDPLRWERAVQVVRDIAAESLMSDPVAFELGWDFGPAELRSLDQARAILPEVKTRLLRDLALLQIQAVNESTGLLAGASGAEEILRGDLDDLSIPDSEEIELGSPVAAIQRLDGVGALDALGLDSL